MAMEQFKVDKIEGKLVKLSLRKSSVCILPEDFANILQYVTLKAEPDMEKIGKAIEAAAKAGAPDADIPTSDVITELIEYFTIKAEASKSKIKAALAEGKTVGECLLLDKKNLQIK